MCKIIFQSPLFCFKNSARRGKLRTLVILLATIKIVLYVGALAYFSYQFHLVRTEYEDHSERYRRQGLHSDQLILKKITDTYWANCWALINCILFILSYSVVLVGGIRVSQYLIVTWISSCWILPVVVIAQLVVYFDETPWFAFVFCGFNSLLMIYLIWTSTVFELSMRSGEDVNLGRASVELTRDDRARGSLRVDSINIESFGGVGQEPSYVIAENTLIAAKRPASETELYKVSSPKRNIPQKTPVY